MRLRGEEEKEREVVGESRRRRFAFSTEFFFESPALFLPRGMQFSGPWNSQTATRHRNARHREKSSDRRESETSKGRVEFVDLPKKKKGEMSPSTFSQKKKNVFFSSRLSFSEFSPYLGTERRADGRSRVGLACREGELDVAGDWGIVFYFEV